MYKDILIIAYYKELTRFLRTLYMYISWFLLFFPLYIYAENVKPGVKICICDYLIMCRHYYCYFWRSWVIRGLGGGGGSLPQITSLMLHIISIKHNYFPVVSPILFLNYLFYHLIQWIKISHFCYVCSLLSSNLLYREDIYFIVFQFLLSDSSIIHAPLS
jgi:hypothetical protein